jgi:hypothetical protein
MNSFGWCPPQAGLIAGAGLYARAQDFHYTKAPDMRSLVKSLAIDPPGKVTQLLQERRAEWYQTESGAWGLQVGAKKHTLAGINFELRKLGAPYGLARLPSGDPVACSLKLPKVDRIAQVNRQELAMGVHFGLCTRAEYEEFLWDHDILAGTTPEEQKELHAFLYGPDPALALSESIADRLEQLTNSHLKNRLIFGVKEYKGPNHAFVGYLYQKRSKPMPAQRRMAGRLAKRFTDDLPEKYRKRADPWTEFQFAIGGAFESLGQLIMPEIPPVQDLT